MKVFAPSEHPAYMETYEKTKKWKNARDNVESLMREHGYRDAVAVGVWLSGTKTYFKIVFESTYCPLCGREHERPQGFYSQYFNSKTNTDPPRAFIGCFRQESEGGTISREVCYFPGALEVYERWINEKPIKTEKF